MNLDVRLEAFADPIGRLSSNDAGGIGFAYAPDYLARNDALQLSMSLSLTEEPFGDFETRSFFDNLLPERDTARADIIAKYGLANDDIVGILFHLGRDCPGAVSVLPEGAPPVKLPGDLSHDYEPYSDALLNASVRALYERRPLPVDAQDPSPLAGVQSKLAVTRLEDGRLASPRNGAPTTHILKVPQERHERDVDREQRAMTLSRACGFDTAATEVLAIDGVPVLLVTRYDRQITEGKVQRLHQEDFCQALGLPSRLKYERNGRPGRRFDVHRVRDILDRCVDPISERQRFLEITLFDTLIGNVDGHAKNFSLFHLPGNRFRTTPRYDVLPTMLDRQTTDQFAYDIGTAATLEALDAAAFDRFLVDLGLGTAAGRRRIAGASLSKAIDRMNAAVAAIGKADKDFGDLVATRIRTLCRNMDRAIPEPAASMDTFVRS